MEEKCYTVYMHICPNNKKYIGITKQNPKKRWGHGTNYSNNKHFTNAIKKYSWENIEHKILFADLTKEEAEQKEIELIAFYKSNQRKYGYNIENGGNCVGKMSEESKLKNRIAHLGRKASLETKQKISNSNLGKHSKKRNDEQKRRISETTRKAMQNSELKIKLSELAKKRKNNTKKVICLETNKEYETIREAEKDTKINAWSIGQNCLGKRKTAGNLHWKFAKEE